MPWGAVVGGIIAAGGAIYASKEASKGAKEAAKIAAQGAEKGAEWQKETYSKIEPYLMKSLKDYQALLEQPEAYQQTPGYMFRLQEGLKAIGIPKGGKYLSGSQIKAATKFAEDYATADYQNALARIAGLGEVASGVGATSLGFGSNIANLYGQQANALAQGAQTAAYARASGILGATSALSQGFGQYAAYKQAGPGYSYYSPGMYSGYGANVAGDAYAPAYSGY